MYCSLGRTRFPRRVLHKLGKKPGKTSILQMLFFLGTCGLGGCLGQQGFLLWAQGCACFRAFHIFHYLSCTCPTARRVLVDSSVRLWLGACPGLFCNLASHSFHISLLDCMFLGPLTLKSLGRLAELNALFCESLTFAFFLPFLRGSASFASGRWSSVV